MEGLLCRAKGCQPAELSNNRDSPFGTYRFETDKRSPIQNDGWAWSEILTLAGRSDAHARGMRLTREEAVEEGKTARRLCDRGLQEDGDGDSGGSTRSSSTQNLAWAVCMSSVLDGAEEMVQMFWRWRF